MLIAPDSFKGSLKATEAAQAIERGIRQALPGAVTRLCPMADGGEGTLDALTAGAGYRLERCASSDPLGRPLSAHYALSETDRRAVVELAAASGLPLLSPAERDPLRASTRGTGEVILQAAGRLSAGGEVLVCLGGSATTDGGAGILRALGLRFLDAEGRELPEGGAALRHLARVDASGLRAEVRGLRFRLACDVTNPLTGPQGAAAIYGPQKGASPEQVSELDAALEQLARVTAAQTGRDPRTLSGGGAAGGCAAGLWSWLGAAVERGAPLVAEASGLCRALSTQPWDLLWTGEGRLDAQSSAGKVVSEVARLGEQHGVTVVALAGEVGENAALTGLTAAFALARGPLSLAESQEKAAELLTLQAEQLTRLWAAGRQNFKST